MVPCHFETSMPRIRSPEAHTVAANSADSYRWAFGSRNAEFSWQLSKINVIDHHAIVCNLCVNMSPLSIEFSRHSLLCLFSHFANHVPIITIFERSQHEICTGQILIVRNEGCVDGCTGHCTHARNGLHDGFTCQIDSKFDGNKPQDILNGFPRQSLSRDVAS